MRRIELQDLVPPKIISEQSRNDVLQGLSTVASGNSAPAPGVELQVGQLASAIMGSSSTSSEAGQASNPAAVSPTSDGAAALLQQPVKDVTEQISQLITQVSTLGSTQQTQIGATQDNTQAVNQNTSKASSGGSVGGEVASSASSFLGGGLTLAPLVSGLISLFGGGDTPTVTAPIPFQLPRAVNYEAGLMGPAPQIAPIDYGQNGQPRGPQASSTQQINIQVSAMDSRSFLDHSDEIASAVRQAILNSNSLNDVISDL